MSEEKYHRKVQTAVNCFLHHGDEFLMLKRALTKRVDPGKLSHIGGRVEAGEDFVQAAIREIKEEAGYDIEVDDLEFAGFGRLEGGYSEDWLMCIFKVEVKSKEIPKGSETDDGELIWIHKDKVLDSDYELVDDLRYYFKDLAEGKDIFFMNAQMDDQEKVESISISKLNK